MYPQVPSIKNMITGYLTVIMFFANIILHVQW
jgi:ribosomal protein S17E